MRTESTFERNVDEPRTRFVNHLERSPDPQADPVLMLCDPGYRPEKAAEVICRHPYFASNRMKCQRLLPSFAQNLLDAMHDVPRVSGDSGLPPAAVNGGNHSVQQEHDRLFHFQWFLVTAAKNVIEQSPLKQVSRCWREPAREAKRSLRSIINGGVVKADHVSGDIGADSEPVTSITLGADCVSEVGLTFVIERHDIWVRHEGVLMFVLNLDRGSREYEAKCRSWTRVMKARMIGATSERPHAHGPSLENRPVKLPNQLHVLIQTSLASFSGHDYLSRIRTDVIPTLGSASVVFTFADGRAFRIAPAVRAPVGQS